MNHADFVTWPVGRTDAMGQPFSSWLLARSHEDSRPMRDSQNHRLHETQADLLARQSDPRNIQAAAPQMELFA